MFAFLKYIPSIFKQLGIVTCLLSIIATCSSDQQITQSEYERAVNEPLDYDKIEEELLKLKKLEKINPTMAVARYHILSRTNIHFHQLLQQAADFFISQKKFEYAIENLVILSAKFPLNERYHYKLSFICFRSGYIELGIQVFRRYLDLTRNNEHLLRNTA
jgi:tetratricopeptide (TPR) repeat protein